MNSTHQSPSWVTGKKKKKSQNRYPVNSCLVHFPHQAKTCIRSMNQAFQYKENMFCFHLSTTFPKNYLYLLFPLSQTWNSICGGGTVCCLNIFSLTTLCNSNTTGVQLTHPVCRNSKIIIWLELIQPREAQQCGLVVVGSALCRCDAWNYYRCYAAMWKASPMVKLAQRTESRQE